jgi:hypothetical protein
MGKNKPKNDGSMPSVVVNQLFEHSPGGFILFYFNQENGAPEQVMSFDSPAHCLALQKYIQDWDEALHQVTLDQSVQTIQDNIQKMNGEEPEE